MSQAIGISSLKYIMEDSSDARVQLCRQELLKLDIQVKTGITQLESEFNYESMAELTRFSQRLKEKSNSIDDLIVDFIGLAKEQKTEEVKTELIKVMSYNSLS